MSRVISAEVTAEVIGWTAHRYPGRFAGADWRTPIAQREGDIAAGTYGCGVETLETPRLILQPWSEADREPFCALAANPEVMRDIADGSTWDRQRAREVFERQLRHWGHHGFGWRSATDKSTSLWIGFIALNHVGPETIEVTEDEVEIGWWLEPSYWRKGLATEGAIALRDEGFGRVGLARIIGRYQPDNVASGRIMETLGMTFERDAVGRHGDTVRIFALSRDRWLRMTRSG